MRKYNTGEWGFALPPELPPSGFDDSPDSLMSNVSRPGCSQFGFPTAIGWSDRDKALRTSQPIIANIPAKDGERPQALKQTTNLRENINTPDSGTDYATLTRLMIQYMKEAISSGAVFTDSADHIGNGWHLFSWTHEAAEAIEATRTIPTSDVKATPAWKYLADDAYLEPINVEEHPLLLSTIFAIWKSTTLVDDGGEISSLFLHAVLRNCETPASTATTESVLARGGSLFIE